MKHTPVEKYKINGISVFVKREDICFEYPAPPFSKVRGILKYLSSLKTQGITCVGYTETSISMAGWGVAWACKKIGLNAIIFEPQYKNPLDILLFHKKMWEELGAQILPIKAGMAKVNWYISKNMLKKIDSNAILLPLGLPFHESVEETAMELEYTLYNLKSTPKSIIVNIGSGTIAAGVWKGINNWTRNNSHPDEIKVYGIMGRKGNKDKKLNVIGVKSGIIPSGIFQPEIPLILIDPGWEYTEKSEQQCPFPCHPYYDLKAWQWLVENIHELKQPILFWNIGQDYTKNKTNNPV